MHGNDGKIITDVSVKYKEMKSRAACWRWMACRHFRVKLGEAAIDKHDATF